MIWCGNNEVETGWYHWGDRQEFKESISPEARDRVWQDYVIMFADILKNAVSEYTDPVPYWPSSPSADFEEIPDNQHNGDMHYWAVWHQQAPARRLYQAISALHDGIRISIFSRDANHPDICQ